MLPLGSHVFNHPARAGEWEAHMVWAILGLLTVFILGGISFAFYGTPWKGRRPRLTAWHRTAIVLSVVWMVVVTLWRVQVAQALQNISVQLNLRICYDMGSPETSRECADTALRQIGEMLPYHWLDSVTQTGAALLGAWILAYMALWATIWIRRGQPRKAAA